MTWTKLPLESLKLAFAVNFALASFTPVQAQSAKPFTRMQRPPLNLKGDSSSKESTQGQGTPTGTVPGGVYARGGVSGSSIRLQRQEPNSGGNGGNLTIDARSGLGIITEPRELPPTGQRERGGTITITEHGGLPTLTFEQPPAGQGAPRGTQPGGERGCPSATHKPLTALMPVTEEANGKQLRWGLTTKERPTFWFYVPYESKSIRSVKFSLRNKAKQTVYETPITLTGTPGVISVSLPSTAPPLEMNEWYQSYLFVDISCTPGAPLEKDYAQGWVKREALTPALESELGQATTPRQRANLYARDGVWYEAVTTLAEVHRTDSEDDGWTKLLQSVGLDAIASEPIVNCCKPEN